MASRVDPSLANNNPNTASSSKSLVRSRQATMDDGCSRSGPLSMSSKSKVECPGLLSPSTLYNNNNGERRTTLPITGAMETGSTATTKTMTSGSKNSIIRYRRNKEPESVFSTTPHSLVEREGERVERMEKGEDDTIRAIVEVSNSINYMDRGEGHVIPSSFLARVDPIVDFWTVDEELRGKFQIFYSSTNYFGHHHPQQQQQAIIFKVKTTSPYNFLVKPVYGLMRPNVVASVEVTCEMRASRLRMEMDEFLVEIAPVPGAIAGMTSDLYTSRVSSNFPELMAVWERIEAEVKNGNYEFVREFHRISCRFHRTAQDLQNYVAPFPPPLKGINDQIATLSGTGEEEGQLGPLPFQFQDSGLADAATAVVGATASQPKINNNFGNVFTSPKTEKYCLQENSSFTQPSQIECYLAREYPSKEHEYDRKPRNANQPDQKRNCCLGRCSVVTKLKLLCFILALFLVASLLYIYFSETNHYNDETHHHHHDPGNNKVTISSYSNKNNSKK